MKILDIKLTYNCNNHCALCCQDDAIKNEKSTIPKEDVLRFARAYLQNANETKIVLTGGEPTTHPELVQIIKELKGMGFFNIQLQTNATFKGCSFSIQDIINAGVDSFGISLHGNSPEMHETFTNTPNSFKNTIHSLLEIQRYNIPVALNCVISNKNVHQLSEIVDFVIADKLAESIQFAFIHITGRAYDHHEQVPRISVAADSVIKSINEHVNDHIIIKSEAIPFCLMRGYEKHVAEIEKLNDITILDKRGVLNFSSRRENVLKKKNVSCKQCLFYSMCEGPWHEYPDLFGWEEFKPVKCIKKC